MNILLVEDNPLLARKTKHFLHNASCSVDLCLTGTDALIQLTKQPYDVLLLDIGLPDISGLQVLEHIRKAAYDTKILIVSSSVHSDDVIKALDAGADDYMRKPCALKEVQSRIAALLRRGQQQATSTTLKHKGFEFDSSQSLLRFQGKEVLLTKNECKILNLLFKHPSDVVPFQTFMEQVWGDFSHTASSTLHVHISHLRRKITSLKSPPLIHTCGQVGYRLA